MREKPAHPLHRIEKAHVVWAIDEVTIEVELVTDERQHIRLQMSPDVGESMVKMVNDVLKVMYGRGHG